MKNEETTAKKRERISKLKQMQRRLDAKLSLPKNRNPVVYKPMEQDQKAVQFKLQDNYK